jgi:hypothetical protein
MKISFYARFTKNGFISHFMPIPLKRETKGYFSGALPMKDPLKTMKRDGAKTGALVSCKMRLVSPRFTFRFVPFCYRSAYGS